MNVKDLLPCKPWEGPPLPRGWFKRGETPIQKMLDGAAQEERYTAAMYREMADEAEEHGEHEVANLLRKIAEDEDGHRKRLEKLAEPK